MRVLVTGGAGYVGSHTVVELMAGGCVPVVLDNLSTGHRAALQGSIFYHGDVRDGALLDRIFQEQAIDSVVHLAASSLVEDSVQDPLAYYDNNLLATHCLLSSMRRHGVRSIVFSSTSSLYGESDGSLLTEAHPALPTNPYGASKLAVEELLRWCERAYGMRAVILRYFNAAGAHERGHLGEHHDDETHLIPLVLQTALGQRESLQVFGTDYATKDGTCIRDYVHVTDLADAHLRALERLQTGRGGTYNLGNGAGFTVQQVVDVARAVTGHAIPARAAGRRPGDPPHLVSSSARACAELGWRPRFASLESIVGTAWLWHQGNPLGYASPALAHAD